MLEDSPALGAEPREYLLMAAMAGALAAGHPAQALGLWDAQAPRLHRAAGEPAFRLLRCHAQRGAGCVAAFRAYAAD